MATSSDSMGTLSARSGRSLRRIPFGSLFNTFTHRHKHMTDHKNGGKENKVNFDFAMEVDV